VRQSILIYCLLVLGGCSGDGAVTIEGQTMGTTYSVKIVGDDVPDSLKAKIDAELVHVNDLMSTYQADSELSRFNESPIGEWFPASEGTLKVLALSRELYELSGGSFDVTVGPLVNLWGFGPDPLIREIPPQDTIDEAMGRIGFDLIEVREGAVRRTVDAYVDLSAIAKGYGVDRVAAILDEHAYENYLVEIGGELRAKGINDRGTPWRIAIERPDTGQRMPFKAIEVSNVGMATSGDYRNFFEVDGVRYSHTIDPSTGYPITHGLASVTVLATTCARADGLATAISVMGPERGMRMAEEQGIAAFAIIKDHGEFHEVRTLAFEEYLHD
jgi:thiamine biosynthesis lipoprotein